MNQKNFSKTENLTSEILNLNDWELDGFSSKEEYQKWLDYQNMDIFIAEILLYIKTLKPEYQQPFLTILMDKIKYEL